MTRDIQIVQLGLGGVGQELALQLLKQRDALAERDGFRLNYLALLDSSGALHTGEPLPADTVREAVQAKQAGHTLIEHAHGHTVANWLDLLPDTPCIVVDVTAADGMEHSLLSATQAGHRVVLANKRPLSSSYPMFEALTSRGAVRYEATAGAGLPIISTVRSLLDSGDELTRLDDAMSGTLGYLCMALEERSPLSLAVRTARSRGWTEPDPRDDLSGADVARKALILARTWGLPWELDAIPTVPWFPPHMANLSVDVFMDRVSDLDAEYADRVTHAHVRNATLRYVATIQPAGATVELNEVDHDHPLAAVRGTDNLFIFTTRRYADLPLVVRGPGAGIGVTAAGVLGDVVATSREM
jgi:homoserine dehydrogenase